jgi:hypothetical protein
MSSDLAWALPILVLLVWNYRLGEDVHALRLRVLALEQNGAQKP